jgi:hypothetical protein
MLAWFRIKSGVKLVPKSTVRLISDLYSGLKTELQQVAQFGALLWSTHKVLG